MSQTVKLITPITAHDEEISELTFREPTTKDTIEIGLPTLIIISEDKSTGVEVRQKVVAKYISKLCGIPKSSVECLSLTDFSACTKVVMGFFGGGDSEETES